MIQLKDKAALWKMAEAGKRLAEIFTSLPDQVQVGVQTQAVDAWIGTQIKRLGMVSETKGYHGYRHVSCISVNDELVHGVPGARVIKDGDMVTVDICASWEGYCADMARMFFVGEVLPRCRELARVAQEALDAGIEKACPGGRLSDISAAIQQVVERHKFGVVRDFAGHGIGRKMHEDPEVLNYGRAGQGALLKAGMTLAIEPMITDGSYDVYVAADRWTVKTVDGGLCAHVEDTVAITENGPWILTRIT